MHKQILILVPLLMYRSSGILTLTAVSYLGDELWTAQAPLEPDLKGLVGTSDGCCAYLTGDSLVKVNSDGSEMDLLYR